MTNGKKPGNFILRSTGNKAIKALKSSIVLRAVMIVCILILTAVLLFSMTAAWFSNVAQSGGLTFTTETWNFNGNFLIEDKTFKAAPGDEGIINMSLSNNGELTVAASLTASKEAMDETMRKRIYFYVDASAVRNDELVDRVWVSSSSSYTYTVFSGDELVSGEEYNNIPPLRWVWVYDVLGYYVKGTVSQDGKMTVQDYIRPVSYDFDEINTTFDQDGRLLTVDGKKSVDTFLSELTSHDGYEGTVKSISEFQSNGYCPIDVNDSGYGVWLYLCTKDEIIENFNIDTSLASDENLSCSATISLTGVNSATEPFEISNSDTLEAVLSASTPIVARLSADVKLDDKITLSSDTYAVLDLNGHAITSSSEDIFFAEAGANLTLLNGKISGDGQNSVCAVKTEGSKITLKNVEIEGVEEGIAVFDHKSTLGADSYVYITDSTISCSEDALWIYGNAKSDAVTTVVVENSTLTGTGYTGIICNGSYKGIDLTVKNTTVTGHYTSIYFPTDESNLNIIDSKLYGYTGLVIKGGNTTITDCTVVGTGDTYNPPEYMLSGWTDTGDGILIDASYDWDTVVTIAGDKTDVSSTVGVAVRKFESDAPNAAVSISGGKFDSDVSAYLANGAGISESGGVYTVTTGNQ
ncbi:MAG: hypothetical protein IKM46_02335 [Clostridia bacterium]|nr:hypothetical protein [Clostridia bacterium]